MSKPGILVISHPGFSGCLQDIGARTVAFAVRVITFRNPQWRGRGLWERARLVKKYDIVHFYWAKIRIVELLVYRWVSRTRVINHFMGTDLYHALHRSARKRLELRLCSRIAVSAVSGYLLQEELGQLGIASEVVPILSRKVVKREYVYPSERSAIAYLPSARRDFFQHRLLLQLALDYPAVSFTWFPYEPDAGEELPGNVIVRGYIDEDEVMPEMEKHRVLLRLPVHDGGAPQTLIEALSIGRWAIWTFAQPYVCTVNGYTELKTRFGELIDHSQPNREGEAYIHRYYTRAKVDRGFHNLYTRTLYAGT